MAVVRSNPVPKGIYWVDLFQPSDSSADTVDQKPIFNAWLRENPGKVKIISSQEFDEPLHGGPLRTFVILKVVDATTAYPFAKLGFLNVADGVQSSDDTAQKPEVEEPGFFEGLLTGGATTALILIGLYLYLGDDK